MEYVSIKQISENGAFVQDECKPYVQKAASKEHSVLGINGSFRQMLQNQKMLESKAENTLNRRMKMEKI